MTSVRFLQWRHHSGGDLAEHLQHRGAGLGLPYFAVRFCPAGKGGGRWGVLPAPNPDGLRAQLERGQQGYITQASRFRPSLVQFCLSPLLVCPFWFFVSEGLWLG